MTVSGPLAEVARLTLYPVELVAPFQLNTTSALPGAAMKLEIAGCARIAGTADARSAADRERNRTYFEDRGFIICFDEGQRRFSYSCEVDGCPASKISKRHKGWRSIARFIAPAFWSDQVSPLWPRSPRKKGRAESECADYRPSSRQPRASGHPAKSSVSGTRRSPESSPVPVAWRCSRVSLSYLFRPWRASCRPEKMRLR